MIMRRLPVLISVLCLFVSAFLARRCAIRTPIRIQAPPAAIFAVPEQQLQLQQLNNALKTALQSQKIDDALQISTLITQQAPRDPAGWYNHSCLLAMNDNIPAAIQSLGTAVQNGFNHPELMQQDPQLASLRSLPQFSLLLRQAGRNASTPQSGSRSFPGPLTSQTATVSARNTRWEPAAFSLITEFQLPDSPLHPTNLPQILPDSPAARLVNQWVREGSAAGLHGLLYDNRDRDHSTLLVAEYRGLTFVEYAPEARAANADYGLRPSQMFNLPTIGNASTAYVDPILWRSNPRMLLSSRLHTMLTLQSWQRNQMYCYPEHRDYDPETGDMFPVNAPWWIISQGSSGSDQPFIKAALLTLAALRPEVRTHLEQTGRLMEIVQWILRRSLKFVDQAEMHYMTGKAHPVVFQESDLDPERMVRNAHELQLDHLPVSPQLSVLHEDAAVPNTDYFSGTLNENLLDTPGVIGRVYRSLKPSRSVTIEVTPTHQLPGRRLQYHWVVLQSGPQQVRISPIRPDRSAAEITINWGPAFDVAWQPSMKSCRVDVGVFVDDGVSVSLPAVISTLLSASESRSYAGNTLMSVSYSNSGTTLPTVDPLLFPQHQWRDDYQYDANGTLTGWSRHSEGQAVAEFDQFGRLKTADQQGQPAAVAVEYEIKNSPGNPPTLQWHPIPARP